MTVSLLCIVIGGLIAYLGKLTQVFQEYDESLVTWGIMLYIVAGVMGLIAVVEFIRSIIRLQRNKQREEEQDLLDITKNHKGVLINAYIGGNDKKRGKSTSKRTTGKKRVI